MKPANTAPATNGSARKLGKWAARWAAFQNPFDNEKLDYLKKRWEELPEDLRTPVQISGRHLTHCGFILGASYCSFHCTHCYLPKNANEVPIPSLDEVKEMIDANRKFQGPGGGLQITGGDVADAYWRAGRADELVEIIRYAYAAGVVPMLMTHGQTLIEQPQFFERLVVEGGLRQVSVHIDMTQAGRHGFPINRITCEADLHPVREAFTKLAWDIRNRTGAKLEYALSFTVTKKNADDVAEVIRWYLADPKRTKIWRMLSFQPEADTGRTLFSKSRATPEHVWKSIQEATGFAVRRDASIFGHPDCNSWCSLLVSDAGHYAPLLPDDPKLDELWGKVLSRIGGLSLVMDDAGTPPYKLASVLLRNAGLAMQLVANFGRLILMGKIPAHLVWNALRGKVHTVGVGMHNFMDAAQVASAATDPTIQARLDACVFKGAVRQNGEWSAVPMCRMNESMWSNVYNERLNKAAAHAATIGTVPRSPQAA